jgi:hypothetical protein
VNPVDIVSVVYTAYGTVRGLRRGLAAEAYRLIQVAIPLVAGCGLYPLVSKTLEACASLGPHVSAPVSFLGTAGGTLWIVHALRRRLRAWLEARLAHVTLPAAWGAAAGAVRALVTTLAVITTVYVTPLIELRRHPGRLSVIERVVQTLLGQPHDGRAAAGPPGP